MRRTIREGDDLLAGAREDDVGSWSGDVLVLSEHLLLLGLLLLDDCRLSYDGGLDYFCELRSLGANLDLAGCNGSYRGDRSGAGTSRSFGSPRTIVAVAGRGLRVLR